MKKYIVILIAIVLALGVLWACAPAMPETSEIRESATSAMSRYIDEEASVVCYIYKLGG